MIRGGLHIVLALFSLQTPWLLQNPSAKGQRFIVSQTDTFSQKFFTDTLKARFPGLKIRDGEDKPVEPVLDNSKALQELGLGKLHHPSSSIVDMAVTLIRKGVVKPQTA